MKLSVIILTKNEQDMIKDCLLSIKDLADEVIVVDSNSTDKTIKLAERLGAKVIPGTGDYATLRDTGLKAATSGWIFYLDADERVSLKLATEIKQTIRQPFSQSYKLPRKNIIFGRWIKHGGFWPDPVHRLFKKEALTGWTGKLHESPRVSGPVGLLKNSLTHYTARSITKALTKSKHWSAIEAQLLYEAKAPRVAWWKIIKAFKFEFFHLFILKLGFLDGMPGLTLSFIRAHHQASVLVNLWQKQQQPSFTKNK